MNHTLLLRLQGPMQAWGVQSRFSVRDTTREPTKSGVIGLLCAALGRSRTSGVDDLDGLKMGVRVDREGALMVDFQTARNVLNAEGKVLKNAVLSTRYYLADAVFLVGLESPDLGFLERLQAALRKPIWLLCLGRKSFPPAAPVWLKEGLRPEQDVKSALLHFPWLIREPGSDWTRQRLPPRLRFVFEAERGAIERNDLPLSFERRIFAHRWVDIDFDLPPREFLNDLEGG